MFSNYALSMSKYMDPLTDVGFKKLFGDDANKDIIISFITDVLELKAPLLDIQFLDKEKLPTAIEDLIGIYDIYCQDVAANRFVVEMKKSRLPLMYPTDQTSYYATFPIVEHLKKTGDLLSY